MDSSKWPSYRSAFRVRAWQVEMEGATPEDIINVTLNGKKVPVKLGDYIVEIDDEHRLEHWTKERFEREFQVEETPRRELNLELDR